MQVQLNKLTTVQRKELARLIRLHENRDEVARLELRSLPPPARPMRPYSCKRKDFWIGKIEKWAEIPEDERGTTCVMCFRPAAEEIGDTYGKLPICSPCGEFLYWRTRPKLKSSQAKRKTVAQQIMEELNKLPAERRFKVLEILRGRQWK